MRLLCALAAIALLVAEAGDAGAVDLRGHWVGTLHTLQGTCPDQRSSTLLVNRRELSFAPGDGVLVLHGSLAPEQSRLHAQLVLPGVNHKPFPMVFEAHPDGTTIAGLYGTPECRAKIRMRRPGDRRVRPRQGPGR